MEDVQSNDSGRISFVRHDLHEFGLSPRTPVLQIVGGSRSPANASAVENSDIFFDKWDQEFSTADAFAGDREPPTICKTGVLGDKPNSCKSWRTKLILPESFDWTSSMDNRC
ncbi:hypothetical protein T01_12372 [Trichinella spiralis]|uniref:Uncharacterized protein n=1 Tax=Trichinella spiralis TaxID=6334 RepID=A0A0V1B514_TRISP|nr:hypothetical protein T01_12372 [Trichinella spiralis]